MPAFWTAQHVFLQIPVAHTVCLFLYIVYLSYIHVQYKFTYIDYITCIIISMLYILSLDKLQAQVNKYELQKEQELKSCQEELKQCHKKYVIYTILTQMVILIHITW